MKMFSVKNTTASRPPDCRLPRVLDPATIRVGARRRPSGADRHKIGSRLIDSFRFVPMLLLISYLVFVYLLYYLSEVVD